MTQNTAAALTGFRVSLLQTVEHMHLSDPDSLSEKFQELWTSSTVTWPRLFKSKDVWAVDPPPSTTKLVLDTLDVIEAAKTSPPAYTVYRRGERDVKIDARTAISQLIQPKQFDPVTIIGLTVLEEGSLSAPLALSEFADAYDISNEQMLLTPKYAHTDIHLDTADGFSIPVGDCVKLWLCFPPTPKNLALMAKADGQKAKLVRIGTKLEGGIIYTTTSAEGIYLPAGTLHTVFTLPGGFLASLDFNTPKSSRPLAALLTSNVDQFAPRSFREEMFGRLLTSVDLGLANNQEKLALSAWIRALERAVEYGMESPEFKAQAANVWKEFLGTLHSKKVVCPCGHQGSEALAKHFAKSHLEVKKMEVKELCVVNGVQKRETRASSRKRKAEEVVGESTEGNEKVKRVKRG